MSEIQDFRNEATLLTKLNNYYVTLFDKSISNGNSSKLNSTEDQLNIDTVYKNFDDNFIELIRKLDELYLKYSILEKSKNIRFSFNR